MYMPDFLLPLAICSVHSFVSAHNFAQCYRLVNRTMKSFETLPKLILCHIPLHARWYDGQDFSWTAKYVFGGGNTWLNAI